MASALCGFVQLRLALYGSETSLKELVLEAEAFDLLAQSGWQVEDEYSWSLLVGGPKYKHMDLITRLREHDGPREKRQHGRIHQAYELKLVKRGHRADYVLAGLLEDVMRLAVFNLRFGCDSYQLLVSSVSALTYMVPGAQDWPGERAEMWAGLYGAMGAVSDGDPKVWEQLAAGEKKQGVKGVGAVRLAPRLAATGGLFGGAGRKSATFETDAALEWLETYAERPEIGTLHHALAAGGCSRIKLDKGVALLAPAVGHGGQYRPGPPSPDDYVVSVVRVRGLREGTGALASAD